MAYTKTQWVDDSAPAINAQNLNHIEQGIYDADSKANAAAPQSTTYTKTEVDTALGGKVDKVTGKGLSTNDYDDTEKGLVASALQADALTPYRTATAEDVINATKADKTALDKTDRSLDMLWKLNKGQTWDFDVDTDTLYTKTVPSGAKYDSVDMIGGKSVVMNQLVSTVPVSQTINGLTVTNNGDGSVTINGTATARTVLNCNAINSFPVNHKVLLIGCPNGGALETYYLADGYASGTAAYRDFGEGAIGTPTAGKVIAQNVIVSGVTVSNIVVKPQIVDLTIWFGSGNEPTTTTDEKMEQVTTWLATNPPYNTGEIKSASVDEVEVVGKNLVNIATPVRDQILIDFGYDAQRAVTVLFRVSNMQYTSGGATLIRLLDSNGNAVGNIIPTQFTNAAIGYSGDIYYTTSAYSFSKIVFKSWSGITGITNTQISLGTTTSYSPYSSQTFTIPSAVQALEGYGQSNGTTYNYVDYANKKYHYFGKYVDGVWTPAQSETITDISSLLTEGFLEAFDVEAGGSLTYKNSNGDGFRIPAVVTNEFICKLDEVQ